MKPSFVVSLAVLAASVAAAVLSAWSYAALSGEDEVLAAKRETCFRAHRQLMDKPAVKNPRICWLAHGHLMERSRKAAGSGAPAST